MRRKGLTFLLAAMLALPVAASPASPAPAQVRAAEPDSGGGLVSFRSDDELRAFLRGLMEEVGPPLPPPPPPSAPAPPSPGASADFATRVPVPPAPGITNTQIAGVDEGGIVKLSGSHLVILRRGRLFTISLADRSMRPISSIDAFPPGVNAQDDWYDEMLIAGDRVIVVGYSDARGGTQISRFRLGGDGQLSFEDSYHVRSYDYYSAQNYATRLVGTRLYLYTPLDFGYFEEGGEDPVDRLPAIRRWRSGDAFGPFRRLASARRVFIPRPLLTSRDAEIDTLHSIYSCDVTAAEMDCEATAVLGSYARTFFVSNNAVYLWITDAWRVEEGEREGADAFLYRVPLEGGRPSAVGVRGAPIDQFSFLPDAPRSALHVLVAASGGGDAMWNSEVTTEESFALLSVPMTSFGDGSREVPLRHYSPVPRPTGRGWSVHNRFVGDHLLYARGNRDRSGEVTVVSLEDRNAVRLPLTHGVDRIDAIGPDAIVLGTGEGFLGFTPIGLRSGIAAGEEFRLPNARQGEARSHAFFFRPDPASGDGASGLLGLPVARFVQDPGGAHLGNSAGILFLARSGGRFAEAGQLNAGKAAGSQEADGCQASCVDWYGNSRPIFLGDRLFALLGYELVEGREGEGRVTEADRVDFTPRPESARP